MANTAPSAFCPLLMRIALNRNRATRVAAWLAVIFLAALSAAHAQESRHALIIGVSEYSDPNVSALSGVASDIGTARSIASSMGIPEANMRVLRDKDATKQNVIAELQALSRRVPAGGRAFIYFSGHGTRWHDPTLNACAEGLMTYDTKTVSSDEIAQYTRRISEVADKTIVLFDACFSGGVNQMDHVRTRSLSGAQLVPKFLQPKDSRSAACMQAVNLRTRSLEVARLGALSENFVQITSARRDEVSFDEPGKGGLATQGIYHCLRDPAADADRSGGTTLQEIEACTQRFIDAKLKPFPELIPHHVTISGARNIIPVALSKPPAALTTPQPPAPAPVVEALPAPPSQPAPPVPVLQPSPPPQTVTQAPGAVQSPPASVTTPVAQPPASPPAAPVLAPEPPLASIATLKDIAAQASPQRKLEVQLNSASLKIKKDALSLQLRSSHDGYVYLVLLGSDQKSFYLLYPNGLDSNNRIKANTWMTLPRPDWQLIAQGPSGTNQLLVLVSDAPRQLGTLTMSAPTAAEPFTYSLTDWGGRQALIGFFTGAGVGSAATQRSERFAARLVSIKEVH
jgi:hypothetical protein